MENWFYAFNFAPYCCLLLPDLNCLKLLLPEISLNYRSALWLFSSVPSSPLDLMYVLYLHLFCQGQIYLVSFSGIFTTETFKKYFWKRPWKVIWSILSAVRQKKKPSPTVTCILQIDHLTCASITGILQALLVIWCRCHWFNTKHPTGTVLLAFWTPPPTQAPPLHPPTPQQFTCYFHLLMLRVQRVPFRFFVLLWLNQHGVGGVGACLAF